jgi:hypothetical protein
MLLLCGSSRSPFVVGRIFRSRLSMNGRSHFKRANNLHAKHSIQTCMS